MKKRLILTSSGINSPRIIKKFDKLVNKKRSEIKILVLYGQKHPKYLAYVKKELKKLGFDEKNIIYTDINYTKLKKSLEEIDVLYFMGGETFVILKKLRATGSDKLIKKFVNSGKIYVGASASSIIAGPNIKIASWGSDGEENLAGLKEKEWNGLNLTKVSIYPHYKDKLSKEIVDFKKEIKNKYLAIALKDGEAVIINGNKKEVLK
ncbi:Peptidase E [uncultured archaeon]|nr:Peptidase E [uncultured archaeon]